MSNEITRVIRGRRTIGSFRPDAPPLEIVESVVDAARWAPNHKKTEPWRVYLVGANAAAAIVELNSKLIEAKKGAAEADSKRKVWSAVPGWLAVTSRRSSDSFLEEEDYAACCCFIQNLMLGFWSHQIGTKWSTGDVTREPEFYRLLSINPDAERVIGLIWYGYPAVIPEQTRKPLDSFTIRIP